MSWTVSSATVSKIWKSYCQTGSQLSPLKHRGGNPSRLSNGDLQLIEVLKRQKPSITHAEVMDCLYDCGDLPLMEHYFSSSGVQCCPKQTTQRYVAQERFTIANMAYTQLFVDLSYMPRIPIHAEMFWWMWCETFPSNNTRKYGHACSYWSNLHEHSFWSSKYIRLSPVFWRGI